MAGFTEHSDTLPYTRRDAMVWAVLLVVVIAARVAVAPAELFEWDSANYALGMRDFNVFEHQPHPPGYPLFVALLKLASVLFPGTGAFVAVNALMTAGVLACAGFLVRPFLGRGDAFFALAVACCPLFWMHGAASTAYVAEAMCSIGVAASCVAVLRGQLPLVWAAAVWALLLGIRPNGALTLTPLMAFTIWRRPAGWMGGLASFTVVSAGWFFPMIAESGGVHAFREATAALSAWQFRAGSALSGDGRAGWRNLRSLSMYLADALNFALLLPLVSLPSWARRSAFAPVTLGFFVAWLGPPTAYYVLHHLPKSGYALTVIPGLAVVVVLLARDWRRVSLVIGLLYAVLNAALFIVAVPVEAYIYKDAPELVPDDVWVLGDYSARGLRYRTRPLRQLGLELADADPDRDALVFLSGAHELQRTSMAAHPEFEAIALFAEWGKVFSTRDAQGYGDYQLEVLSSPKLRGTDRDPSVLSWVGTTMRVERAGDVLEWSLDAERALIVVPCPPCAIDMSTGVSEAKEVDLGAGYIGIWVRPKAKTNPANPAPTP
ncbi:MAG: hypothetical protein KC912_08985 [Proteobacteria bacterium]|nr:hypothetical protein [Pseudomonadota bacterium]